MGIGIFAFSNCGGMIDYCFCVSDWQNWNAAIERGRVGVNQRRAFAEIFAAEGGSSGAGAAGITDDRLATIGPNVEISHASPAELMHDQLLRLYVGYFDSLLGDVGGVSALENIGDELAAVALADALFDTKELTPVKTVQRAINRIFTPRVPENGVFGEQAFAAYRKLSEDRVSRNLLLDALADNRRVRQDRDDERISHFQFRDIRGSGRMKK